MDYVIYYEDMDVTPEFYENQDTFATTENVY